MCRRNSVAVFFFFFYGLKKIYKIERTQAVLSVPLIGALFLMQREDKNGN